MKENRVRKIGQTRYHKYEPSSESYEYSDENGDDYYVRDHYTTPKERKTNRSNHMVILARKGYRAETRAGWAQYRKDNLHGAEERKQCVNKTTRKPVTKKPVRKVVKRKPSKR